MIAFALALGILSTNASANWYISDHAVSTEKKTAITDEPYEFKLGTIKCGVTRTEFHRQPNDATSEYRELYCWTSKDTRVSILVSCNLPAYAMESLTIQKRGKTSIPALTCGPNTTAK